jgi:hypothetical protein
MIAHAVNKETALPDSDGADRLNILRPYQPPTLTKRRVLSAIAAEVPPLSSGSLPDGG